jgi:pimeloyl-ACP methyl ester carboxylesterase
MSNVNVTRRDFAALAAGAVGALMAESAQAAETSSGGAASLDLAEWSYFWVGVERAELARGTVVNGKQMYVEYQISREVKHPYPIVLVHGGGGQGTDWMGTPDGRRGWSTMLVEQGYKGYVVDRPGHGKSPFHPDLHGAFPAQNITLDQISGLFTPQRMKSPNTLPSAKLHNQWPGSGAVGTPELAQLVASQGGSYVAGAGPEVQHEIWRSRGAELLDKIGPAIIITHSAGGPFGWLVAEARPKLVKGIVVIEGAGAPFAGPNKWGHSTIPVTYDPPVKDAAELKTVEVPSPEPGVQPYKIQAEPARKLKNLMGIPMVLVTAEASFASPGAPGAVAFLKQAGCVCEELRLADHGVHGNGHMMMVEKNNREVLQPILAWLDKNVSTKGVAIVKPKPAESAVRLADQGYFWVGTDHKKMPYGTIVAGQMYVQWLKPAESKHSTPVVLVHGGGGQGGHYQGVGNGAAGWAHYYLQEGYTVYIVDRPGHGRSPYHPDSLGPIGQHPTYQTVTVDFKRAAQPGPNRRWMGTGDVGDPVLDQFQSGQNAAPQDNLMAQKLWASRGGELLDRIGPAIIQVHSAGGPFSWLVANERPQLVKAIVNVEGAGNPFAGNSVYGLTQAPVAFDPPVNDPKELNLREVKVEVGSPTSCKWNRRGS